MKKWILLTCMLLLFAAPTLAADVESGGSTKMNQKQVSPSSEMVDDTSAQTAPAKETPGEETTSEKTREKFQAEEMAAESQETMTVEEESGHGFGHKLLLYIPNRVLDVFDFVRLRGRVGPGIAVGVRATRPLTVAVGGYTSIYAGLPGPRQKPTVKLPLGIENYAGMEVSMLASSSDGRFSPNYSPTEIGVSIHPLLLGIDFCIDPLEVIDLAFGFLFIDIRGDDF